MHWAWAIQVRALWTDDFRTEKKQQPISIVKSVRDNYIDWVRFS